MPEEACFIILCKGDGRSPYTSILKDSDYPHRFVETLEEMMVHCLKQPPLAVLIDIPTQLFLGTERVVFAFNLKMKWPVMRSKALPSGRVQVFCLDPYISASLPDALRGVATADPDWMTKGFNRRYPRLQRTYRVRIGNQEGQWFKAHTLDISTKGAFIVTYEQFEQEQPISVELHDLTSDPLLLEATVKWTRDWNRSQELSGIGVELKECLDPHKFVEAILQDKQFRSLKT